MKRFLKESGRIFTALGLALMLGGSFGPSTSWAAANQLAPAPPSTSTQAGMPPGAMQPGLPSTQQPAPGTAPQFNNQAAPPNQGLQQPGIAGGINENTNITSPGVAPEANPAPTITAGPGAGALGTPPGTYAQGGPQGVQNGS